MSYNKLKVLTIVGTRPEIIRLSRIIPLLAQCTNHITVHTGQNYDYELNEIFYKELELKKPDYFLNVDTSSLGSVIGETISKIEGIFVKERPDACVILGDTNSSLSAIMAKRMKIPIYHLEAGNRSFDINVPEEINRKIVDHIADFNLAYTENSRRHLLAEGLPHRRIYVIGSPMNEVLNYYKEKIISSDILNLLNISKRQYFIVSVHREENVDREDNLKKIIEILNAVADKYKLPIIVSTHPRTKNRLEKLDYKISELVSFLKPFGFFDYNFLQLNSKCAISDSGTISEESAILGFPAVTLRNSMERPEAMDYGSIILTGLYPDVVLSAIEYTIDNFNENNKTSSICPEYLVENTSERVLKLILGTSKLSYNWYSG